MGVGGTFMRRTRSRERGAALVEFALLMPLLIMLILGIVSVGVAYNHQLSLTHSARETARFAATLPIENFANKAGWLDAVAAQAIANGTGTLADGTPGRVICVAYVYPQGTSTVTDPTERRLDDGSGTVVNDSAPCFADGRPDVERRVQVTVARESEFNVLVFTQTLTLDSEAVSRFEAALGS